MTALNCGGRSDMPNGLLTAAMPPGNSVPSSIIRFSATLASGFLLGGLIGWIARQIWARRCTQYGSSQTEHVAKISHDLRIPIASIRCAAENIRDGFVNNDDSLREQATLIVDQSTRAINLVDQFLIYATAKSRRARQGTRALTASEVIDDAVHCVSILVKEGAFILEKEVPPGLPAMRGDQEMLTQCLQNLLTNAMKYSGESRWVGISARIAKSARFAQEEIQISVSDHGFGISRTDLAHIFEPFYRSHDPAVLSIRGSGLGLWIAKYNVEACGGSLSLVSNPGAGSVFTLHLPLT